MKLCSCKGGCSCTNCSCSKYSAYFETLGNQNRLHIIDAIRLSSKNVTQIIKETGLEQTCVSHCLKRLAAQGFVTVKKKGKYRVYHLNKEAIEPILKTIDDIMSNNYANNKISNKHATNKKQ